MIKFESPRLQFRFWTPDDADAALEMYGDAETVQYLASGAPVPSVEAMREILVKREARNEGFEREGLGVWAAVEKAGSKPIGTGLFLPLTYSIGIEGPQEYEIGWHLNKRYWGQGFGTEIGAAMLDVAYQKLDRVIAIAFEQNRASTRIMEKIGMEPAGKTSEFYNVEVLKYVANKNQASIDS